MRTLSVSALISAALLFTACAKKPARAFVPPTPPKQQIPASPALVSPAPSLQAKDATQPPPGILDHIYPAPEPWENRRRRRPVAVQPSTTPQQQQAQQTPLNPTPAPALRLGAMLTPEQTQRLTQEINGSLSRTRRNLDAAIRHNLNDNQKESAGQVRVFLKQAQAAQASDLEAARSLAERAEILSRDLLQSLR